MSVALLEQQALGWPRGAVSKDQRLAEVRSYPVTSPHQRTILLKERQELCVVLGNTGTTGPGGDLIRE